MQFGGIGNTSTTDMFRPSRLTTLLALVLLVERVVTAPTSTSPSNATVSLLLVSLTSLILNTSKVSWDNCTSFGVNSTDSNLQCGFLEVPMDYHDSSAGTARLAAIKYTATVPEKKGTIFFNPGDAFHLLLCNLKLIYPVCRRTRRFRDRVHRDLWSDTQQRFSGCL